MSGRRASRRLGSLVAAATLAVLLLSASPVRAAEPEALSVWKYSLYKTITYEVAANLADIPLYRMLIGGTLAGAGLFTAANAATATAAYYAHEVLWNRYGPSMQEGPETAMGIGIQKMITYRVVSTTRNLALIYAFTGGVLPTITFALVSNVVDASIYAANEYGWYAYGPPVEKPRGSTADVPGQAGAGGESSSISSPEDDAAPQVGAGDLWAAAATVTDGIAATAAAVWSSLR
jgi:uncharacterized membrane protein